MKRRMVWMAACCVVPLVLALGISYLSVGSSYTWLVSLICPVLMIGSLWGMRSSEQESACCEHKGEVENR
ncbi:MAG TPA: hypothetical protein VK191_05340 [Symbiobacteriaceae bacterium]|nr:hypothetical protein [Symbiobacteriaceae bacterium]